MKRVRGASKDRIVDSLLLEKAACRVRIASAVNAMLDHWRILPAGRQTELQEALMETLADVTAECALGIGPRSQASFLTFMGQAFDRVSPTEEEG